MKAPGPPPVTPLEAIPEATPEATPEEAMPESTPEVILEAMPVVTLETPLETLPVEATPEATPGLAWRWPCRQTGRPGYDKVLRILGRRFDEIVRR